MSLMKDHPKLEQNYFDGFHPEVWRADACPQEPDFESRALLREPFEAEVSMRLVKSTLLFFREGSELPVSVVCLEGLRVEGKDGR